MNPRRFVVRVFAMARKEWMHLGRDRATVLFALGMPVILLVLFGYAVSFDIDHIPTVLVDEDWTPESRSLASHFSSGATFELVATVGSAGEVERLFREGHAKVGLVIPKGFGRELARGNGRVQLLVDASDNMTASSVLSYATRFNVWKNHELLRVHFGNRADLIEVRGRALYNPAIRSVVFLVPGLIAMIQSMMAVILTALTVAREWERGSMEQLFATPVGRLEIVLGKLLPYFGVAMAQLLLVLALATWVFGVPIRGSMVALLGISTLFLLATLSQGLFISVMARNQMVATQAAAVSSMLPSMLLSGFVLPIENMPRPLQIMTNIVPARHFVHALRAIMLRDADLSVLGRDAFALVVFALVMLVLATRRFPRRLA